MKISELLKITNIPQDFKVPLIPDDYGYKQYNKTKPLYEDNDGVHYWKDETVWSLSDTETENFRYKAYKMLEKHFDDQVCNERKKNRYYAILLILLAANEYLKIKTINNKQIDIKKDIEISEECINCYACLLDSEIQNALENEGFSEIAEMKKLQDVIRKDKLYREFCFTVTEIQGPKHLQYKSYIKKLKYCFGNVKYHEKLDTVSFVIFEDYGKITISSEGRVFEETFKPGNNISAESKIMTLLDKWKCAYTH